jgi:hypothetical protein
VHRSPTQTARRQIATIGTMLMVLVLVAGAALIAGCGSGSSSAGTSASPPRATAVAAATSTTSGASGRSGSRAAVELSTCNSTAARSRLSSTGKARYLALCKHAVNGAGASVVREAARQCVQIIKQTVPAAAQAALIGGCPES